MSRFQVARLAVADRIARKAYEKQSTWAPSLPISRIRNRPAMQQPTSSHRQVDRQPVHSAAATTTSAPQSSVMQRLQARRERLATQAEQASKKPRPSSDPYATRRERIFAASSHNKSSKSRSGDLLIQQIAPPPAPRQRVHRQLIDPFELLVESLTFESRQSPTQRPRARRPPVDSMYHSLQHFEILRLIMFQAR